MRDSSLSRHKLTFAFPPATRFVFGLKPKCSSSISFLAEDHIVVYPCGHVVVFLDHRSNKQTFISSTKGKVGITALALTPDKRFL